MHARFSRAVEQVLASAGWRPGRSVEIALAVAHLEALGVDVFDSARDFIQEFHGLRVTSHFTKHGHEVSTRVRFDVFDSLLIGENELQFLQEFAKANVCPIGTLGREDLFLTSDEQVYTVAIDWIAIGRARSVPEAFESLFTTRWPDFYETLILDENRNVIERKLADWAKPPVD
jgi:hypothetical protein